MYIYFGRWPKLGRESRYARGHAGSWGGIRTQAESNSRPWPIRCRTFLEINLIRNDDGSNIGQSMEERELSRWICHSNFFKMKRDKVESRRIFFLCAEFDMPLRHSRRHQELRIGCQWCFFTKSQWLHICVPDKNLGWFNISELTRVKHTFCLNA